MENTAATQTNLALDAEERKFLRDLLEDPFTYFERVNDENDPEAQRLEAIRENLLNRAER